MYRLGRTTFEAQTVEQAAKSYAEFYKNAYIARTLKNYKLPKWHNVKLPRIESSTNGKNFVFRFFKK